MWSKTFLKNYFVTLLSVVFCLMVFVFIYNAQAKEGAADATKSTPGKDTSLEEQIKGAEADLAAAKKTAAKEQNEVDSYEEPGGPAFSKDDDEAVLAREEVSRLAARLEALNKQAKENKKSATQNIRNPSEDPYEDLIRGDEEGAETEGKVPEGCVLVEVKKTKNANEKIYDCSGPRKNPYEWDGKINSDTAFKPGAKEKTNSVGPDATK
ncbi:MAG: hypothetical protein ACOYOK_05890 [Pseudobdellovibrionaceae bacterium]